MHVKSRRMANATNLQTHQINGVMRSTAPGEATVLVHHHTSAGEAGAQQGVDSKSGILQHGVTSSVSDMDGNFIHDILGMNSQIEIIDEDVQHHGSALQQHHEVLDLQQQELQQGGHQIQIQNATPEQLLELQQQGGYSQENGNRVIVVSELFKCDICNLAFIFKDHYIQHCDDHIRMVAEHINLKGIVPINNFEESNEILDFRNENEDQPHHQEPQHSSNRLGPDGNIVNGIGLDLQEQQIVVHNQQPQHQLQRSEVASTSGNFIQQQVIQNHIHPQEVMSDNNGHLGDGAPGALDSSVAEDIDDGDQQLGSGGSRPNAGGAANGSGKVSKRTSQQQLQAQLNSEWCKCLPCDFKFRTPLSLSRHLNAHMENRNRCDKCNKFFTSYVSLNTHMRQCQGNIGEEAAHNNFSGGDLDAGERGRSISIDGPATSPGGTVHANKVYHCKKCNLQFTSATQYRDHKLTHSNDVYTCNECQKAFLSIINLNRHRQNEHAHRQTFLCAICNCEFTNIEFLEEHNKTRSHVHNLSGGGRIRHGGGGPTGGSVSRAGRGGDVVVID